MTRPPDFDLTTVEGIVDTALQLEHARHEAADWASVPYRRSRYSDTKMAECAGRWATEAAHHARRLQGVAELVSVSGDLAAWQEWRERGKA